MKLRCPQCDQSVSLFSSACPHCNFALTVGSVLRRYRTRVRERINFQCPKCQQPVPVNARACGHCGALMTWGAAVDATLEPPRRRLHQFLHQASPATKRRIQWVYLLFSAALLWWLLTYVQARGGDHWLQQAALAVLFLSVFALLALWLVPRPVFRALYWGASRLTRLALVCNFLSAMIVLQLLIGVWWGQAAALASLFVVVWAAAVLFHRFLLPIAAQTEQVFVGSGRDQFDTQGAQGRDVRWD